MNEFIKRKSSVWTFILLFNTTASQIGVPRFNFSSQGLTPASQKILEEAGARSSEFLPTTWEPRLRPLLLTLTQTFQTVGSILLLQSWLSLCCTCCSSVSADLLPASIACEWSQLLLMSDRILNTHAYTVKRGGVNF